MSSRSVCFVPVLLLAACGQSSFEGNSVAEVSLDLSVSRVAEPHPPSPSTPTTPIRHVVVIFDENRSFDHYFGTYPHAANLPGERPFHARSDTPTVNGLSTTLLEHN